MASISKCFPRDLKGINFKTFPDHFCLSVLSFYFINENFLDCTAATYPLHSWNQHEVKLCAHILRGAVSYCHFSNPSKWWEQQAFPLKSSSLQIIRFDMVAQQYQINWIFITFRKTFPFSRESMFWGCFSSPFTYNANQQIGKTDSNWISFEHRVLYVSLFINSHFNTAHFT